MIISVVEQQDEIAAACRKYGIERLFIFGSATREDFRPGESDIDLFVEFGIERRPVFALQWTKDEVFKAFHSNDLL